MSIGFIEAMKFPRGYNSKRKKIQTDTQGLQELHQVVIASTLQNVLSKSKVFLSNQLLTSLKLIVIAMIQLEFIMYYTSFNLFYLMQSSKEPRV